MNLGNICSFDNRVAVVTGAGGNIGFALCKRLTAHGVKIAAVDIKEAPLNERMDILRSEGADIRCYVADVTDRDAVMKLADNVIVDFGKVDILINNAGVWGHGKGREFFDEMDPVAWKRILSINIDGVFNCTQAFLPNLLKNKYGRIVNLTSIAGEVGLPGFADYATAKAGIITFTRTLAMENAKRGITVNCVSPGMVAVGEPVSSDTTWVGRTGGADEIARGIVFLAADESGYITGADLPVEGGRILGPHNCNM